MGKRLNNSNMVNRISDLAFGKSNDAVRLVFLDPEQQELIGDLDLSMVSEVKRSASGQMEVKLLDRISLLELLSKLMGSAAKCGNEAESFFSAMDKAASRLDDSKSEV